MEHTAPAIAFVLSMILALASWTSRGFIRRQFELRQYPWARRMRVRPAATLIVLITLLALLSAPLGAPVGLLCGWTLSALQGDIVATHGSIGAVLGSFAVFCAVEVRGLVAVSRLCKRRREAEPALAADARKDARG